LCFSEEITRNTRVITRNAAIEKVDTCRQALMNEAVNKGTDSRRDFYASYAIPAGVPVDRSGCKSEIRTNVISEFNRITSNMAFHIH